MLRLRGRQRHRNEQDLGTGRRVRGDLGYLIPEAGIDTYPQRHTRGTLAMSEAKMASSKKWIGKAEEEDTGRPEPWFVATWEEAGATPSTFRSPDGD